MTVAIEAIDNFRDLLESYIRGGTQITLLRQSNTIDVEVEDKEQIQDFLAIENYSPELKSAIGWLSAVETRIRNSIVPEDSDKTPSTEWLNEEAGIAALAFLQNGADLLPCEPYIYGTQSGDLVAEFETAISNLTTVVSGNQTRLFGVVLNNPREPLEAVILRGSNRYRDELREFTSKLAVEANGEKVGSVG